MRIAKKEQIEEIINRAIQSAEQTMNNFKQFRQETRPEQNYDDAWNIRGDIYNEGKNYVLGQVSPTLANELLILYDVDSRCFGINRKKADIGYFIEEYKHDQNKVNQKGVITYWCPTKESATKIIDRRVKEVTTQIYDALSPKYNLNEKIIGI